MGNGRHNLTPCCALCGHVIAVDDDRAEFIAAPSATFHADCVERVGAGVARSAAVALAAAADATDGATAPTLDTRVRALMRCSKADLARAIRIDAAAGAHHWIIGGPDTWSHDELVNHCVTGCVHVNGVPDGR